MRTSSKFTAIMAALLLSHTWLQAQETKSSPAALPSAYLEIYERSLGDITDHDVMMVSSTVPESVDILRRAGQSIPTEVESLFAEARIAERAQDRYRAYRLYARAAGLARGEAKVEAFEIAASLALSLNRAIFVANETVTLTVTPRFTLERHLTKGYLVESWIENDGGIVTGSQQKQALSELKPLHFHYQVKALGDGVHCVGYRLKSPTGEILSELNYTFLVAKDLLARSQRLKERFAILKTKLNPSASPALVSALETLEFILVNLETERTRYDGHWARTAHPFGMSQKRLTALAQGIRTDERGESTALERPPFYGRIRYPADFILAESLVETIGTDPDSLKTRTGDMGLAFRSSSDGTLLHYRLYVPSGKASAEKRGLVIALHSGAGDSTYFDLPLMRGADQKSIQQLADEHGFIVAVPNGEHRFSGAIAERDFQDLLGRLQQVYGIEAKRTFLIGWSLGGSSAWRLAMRYPTSLGAFVSVTGAATWLKQENTREAAQLPILHCEPEEAEAQPGNQQTQKKASELLKNYSYKSYPGTNHVSVWAKALPDAFALFETQIKRPN